ncbi:MAG TPA: hypothetical protein VGS19_09640 [Streptosporangiaceae bacterium]|nr:hypothetical protein [Streptosporangiaceae bacterium]
MLLAALSALLIVALPATAFAWLLAVRSLRRARESRHRPDAEAALRRHPAGRARPLQVSDGASATGRGTMPGSRVAGPDDDPEFILTLERLIRGDERGQER